MIASVSTSSKIVVEKSTVPVKTAEAIEKVWVALDLTPPVLPCNQDCCWGQTKHMSLHWFYVHNMKSLATTSQQAI